MNDENMVNEVVELVPAKVDFSAGLSTGAAMAIGSVITVVVIFGGKKLIKVIDKRKAKKADAEANGEDEE